MLKNLGWLPVVFIFMVSNIANWNFEKVNGGLRLHMREKNWRQSPPQRHTQSFAFGQFHFKFENHLRVQQR